MNNVTEGKSYREVKDRLYNLINNFYNRLRTDWEKQHQDNGVENSNFKPVNYGDFDSATDDELKKMPSYTELLGLVSDFIKAGGSEEEALAEYGKAMQVKENLEIAKVLKSAFDEIHLADELTKISKNDVLALTEHEKSIANKDYNSATNEFKREYPEGYPENNNDVMEQINRVNEIFHEVSGYSDERKKIFFEQLKKQVDAFDWEGRMRFLKILGWQLKANGFGYNEVILPFLNYLGSKNEFFMFTRNSAKTDFHKWYTSYWGLLQFVSGKKGNDNLSFYLGLPAELSAKDISNMLVKMCESNNVNPDEVYNQLFRQNTNTISLQSRAKFLQNVRDEFWKRTSEGKKVVVEANEIAEEIKNVVDKRLEEKLYEQIRDLENELNQIGEYRAETEEARVITEELETKLSQLKKADDVLKKEFAEAMSKVTDKNAEIVYEKLSLLLCNGRPKDFANLSEEDKKSLDDNNFGFLSLYNDYIAKNNFNDKFFENVVSNRYNIRLHCFCRESDLTDSDLVKARECNDVVWAKYYINYTLNSIENNHDNINAKKQGIVTQVTTLFMSDDKTLNDIANVFEVQEKTVKDFTGFLDICDLYSGEIDESIISKDKIREILNGWKEKVKEINSVRELYEKAVSEKIRYEKAGDKNNAEKASRLSDAIYSVYEELSNLKPISKLNAVDIRKKIEEEVGKICTHSEIDSVIANYAKGKINSTTELDFLIRSNCSDEVYKKFSEHRSDYGPKEMVLSEGLANEVCNLIRENPEQAESVAQLYTNRSDLFFMSGLDIRSKLSLLNVPDKTIQSEMDRPSVQRVLKEQLEGIPQDEKKLEDQPKIMKTVPFSVAENLPRVICEISNRCYWWNRRKIFDQLGKVFAQSFKDKNEVENGFQYIAKVASQIPKDQLTRFYDWIYKSRDEMLTKNGLVEDFANKVNGAGFSTFDDFLRKFNVDISDKKQIDIARSIFDKEEDRSIFEKYCTNQRAYDNLVGIYSNLDKSVSLKQFVDFLSNEHKVSDENLKLALKNFDVKNIEGFFGEKVPDDAFFSFISRYIINLNFELNCFKRDVPDRYKTRENKGQNLSWQLTNDDKNILARNCYKFIYPTNVTHRKIVMERIYDEKNIGMNVDMFRQNVIEAIRCEQEASKNIRSGLSTNIYKDSGEIENKKLKEFGGDDKFTIYTHGLQKNSLPLLCYLSVTFWNPFVYHLNSFTGFSDDLDLGLNKFQKLDERALKGYANLGKEDYENQLRFLPQKRREEIDDKVKNYKRQLLFTQCQNSNGKMSISEADRILRSDKTGQVYYLIKGDYEHNIGRLKLWKVMSGKGENISASQVQNLYDEIYGLNDGVLEKDEILSKYCDLYMKKAIIDTNTYVKFKGFPNENEKNKIKFTLNGGFGNALSLYLRNHSDIDSYDFIQKVFGSLNLQDAFSNYLSSENLNTFKDFFDGIEQAKEFDPKLYETLNDVFMAKAKINIFTDCILQRAFRAGDVIDVLPAFAEHRDQQDFLADIATNLEDRLGESKNEGKEQMINKLLIAVKNLSLRGDSASRDLAENLCKIPEVKDGALSLVKYLSLCNDDASKDLIAHLCTIPGIAEKVADALNERDFILNSPKDMQELFGNGSQDNSSQDDRKNVFQKISEVLAVCKIPREREYVLSFVKDLSLRDDDASKNLIAHLCTIPEIAEEVADALNERDFVLNSPKDMQELFGNESQDNSGRNDRKNVFQKISEALTDREKKIVKQNQQKDK